MILRTIPVLLALLVAPAAAAPIKAPKPAKTRTVKPEPPVTVDSLLAQSKSAIASGDTQLAVRLAQSAIVADPAQPRSYIALGDIYALGGEAEYARSFYDAALGIDPAEPAALKAIAALDKSHTATEANAHP